MNEMQQSTNGRGVFFFYGIICTLILGVGVIVLDTMYFDGMLTTQRTTINRLENDLANTTYSLAEHEAINKKLGLILGIHNLDEAKELILEKDISDEKVKLLQKRTTIDMDELNEKDGMIDGLKSKVSYLESQFNGAFKEILKNFSDMTVAGDRFAFKTDVLFHNASATLSLNGKNILEEMATRIMEVDQMAPAEIRWFIRIDGHTNHLGIHTDQYPSNWYLSTGRAISVIEYLIKQGVPPHRLGAAGFSSYWPLVSPKDGDAIEQNRRIEVSFSHY